MLELFNTIFRKWFRTRAKQDGTDSDKRDVTRALLNEESAAIGIPPTAHLVPYDENLLERARTQWEFGDWAALASIERDVLQHHPDRAKLALLAAAGHMQSNNTANAKQFVRLAQDWGCNKKLIAQILAAGVHNSLGRASAVVGQHDRAVKHFTSAITTGIPGAEARLLGRARATEQLRQLGGMDAILPAGVAPISASPANQLVGAPYRDDIRQLTKSFIEQKCEIESQIKKQSDDLSRFRSAMDLTIKRELNNATKQIESFIGLQSYFASGDLPMINPERHSWPISSDFGLYLIELLETNPYDLVIEFGSGISTVLVAKALAKMAPKADVPPMEFVSFDHLEKYFTETRARLQQAGVDQYVRVVHAPLKAVEINGHSYEYYDCEATLADLTQRHPGAGLRVLVIVDGPPAATGKNARYPACPKILSHFAGAAIDFLLDDYIRDDEKEIARMWEAEIAAAGLTCTTSETKLEKDACLIRIYPPLKESE